ncbi:tetratricopeptide repeat protein [Geomonas ferrireducens]|uniref:tetratricopeptide repeat protein n=1 Tax=Geomonas ferrireducens TaxID=2570227 RepID=UPI0010A79277|nr:tetratricopeptide repeat protein [Geomonas ferrireducens]
MVEDALSFWTEIQRYEDLLAKDAKSLCFAPLSELYRKLGLLDDAISVARKGCAAHPEYPLGLLALGNACYAKGESTDACQALEKAVELKPDHIQAMKLLSQIYVELGRVDAARNILGRVLQRDPEDLESAMLLGSIVSMAPSASAEDEILEEVEIIEELEDVIEEAPDRAPAPFVSQPVSAPKHAVQKSTPVSETDDFWAIEDLEGEPELEEAPPAAASRPGAPDPLTTATLAELYVSQGFLEKAQNIYRELLTAHPGNPQYRLRLEELAELQELQLSPVDLSSAQAPAATPPPDAPVAPQIASAPVAVAPDLFVEPAGLAEAAAPVAAPFAPSLPTASEEIPAAAAGLSAAFAGMESPAEQEAAPLENPGHEDAGGTELGVESALERWLENIRRRKDGV